MGLKCSLRAEVCEPPSPARGFSDVNRTPARCVGMQAKINFH